MSGFLGGLSGHQVALRSAFLIKCGLTKESFLGSGIVIACLGRAGANRCLRRFISFADRRQPFHCSCRRNCFRVCWYLGGKSFCAQGHGPYETDEKLPKTRELITLIKLRKRLVHHGGDHVNRHI